MYSFLRVVNGIAVGMTPTSMIWTLSHVAKHSASTQRCNSIKWPRFVFTTIQPHFLNPHTHTNNIICVFIMHNNFQYLRRHFVQTLLVQQPLDGHGCHIVAAERSCIRKQCPLLRLNTPLHGRRRILLEKVTSVFVLVELRGLQRVRRVQLQPWSFDRKMKWEIMRIICVFLIWWHLLRIGLSPCLRGKFMSIWWIWWIEAKHFWFAAAMLWR